MSKLWTLEREVQLRTLHRIGWSAGEMARELGLTRNAVVGKCKRLGLPLIRQPAVRHDQRQRPLQPAQDGLPGVAVLEVRGEHCRWPINADGAPYRFCGAPRVFPFAWCVEHGKRAYRVLPVEFSHPTVASEPVQPSHPKSSSEPSFVSHPHRVSEPSRHSHPAPASEPTSSSHPITQSAPLSPSQPKPASVPAR
jgi:GcrA cell cycle regulator